MAELRDHSAGRLVIGANESTGLYLLSHIERVPAFISENQSAGQAEFFESYSRPSRRRHLGLGVISFEPRDERFAFEVIFTDSLAFVVWPEHRLAKRKAVPIRNWGMRLSSRTTCFRLIGNSC